MLTIPTASGAVATLFSVSIGLASAANAQENSARIALSAGVATDQRGVNSSAVTVAPSVRLQPNDRASLSLGASATRFATQTWSLGAGAALDARDPIGRFAALTLNSAVNASRLQSSPAASFVQADLIPALELRLSRLTLFGGVRAATGYASEQMSRTIPIGGPTSGASSTRSGAGPLAGALLTLSLDHSSVQIGAREDRLRIDGDEVVDRSINASLSSGALTLAGSAGVRGSRDERVSFGSGGLSVAMGSGASLDVAAGRYASNRLLGTPGGRFMNVGLSFRVGQETPGTPRAANVAPAARGWTRLTIRAPDATRVDVAGDFNEWKPVAAQRAANGVWYADLRIPPGQYRYAFRVNGSEWRVPDGATAVEDDFGGKSAWLTVR